MNDKPLPNSEASADAMIEKKIVEALEHDRFELPYGFADQVVRRIQSRKESLSRDYIWLSVGLFILVGASVATAFYIKFSFDLGAFKFLTGYGKLLVFTVAIILLLQWVDRNVLHKNLHSSR